MLLELRRLYAELDADAAALGGRCDRSGRCCRFADFGHRLYLTSVERELFLDGVDPATLPLRDGVCPFLTADEAGRPTCGNRDHRALGCRLYFCNLLDPAPMHAVYEKYHERIKRLGERFGVEYRYGELIEMVRRARADRCPGVAVGHSTFVTGHLPGDCAPDDK
jgi:hypothetical protein